MAVPKQHRSKPRQGQRRQHIFIKTPVLHICPKCRQTVRPHTVCENCGTYRGKEIIDVMAKLNKKERKQKEKEIAQNQPQ